jgi:hypothetical protein
MAEQAAFGRTGCAGGVADRGDIVRRDVGVGKVDMLLADLAQQRVEANDVASPARGTVHVTNEQDRPQ